MHGPQTLPSGGGCGLCPYSPTRKVPLIRRGENRQRSGSEAPEYVTVEAPDEGGEWVRAAFTVAEWATGTSRARKNPEDFEPETALPSEDQVVAWLLAEANRDPEARSDAMRSLLRHGRSIGRFHAGRFAPGGDGPPLPTVQVAPSLTYPTPTSAQLVLRLIVTDSGGNFESATTTITKPGGATVELDGLEPTVTGLTTAGTIAWSVVLHTVDDEDTDPVTGSLEIELGPTTAPTALYEATDDGFAVEVEDQSTGNPTLVRLDLGDGTKVVIGQAAAARYHAIQDGLAVTLVDTSQGIPTGTTTVVWGDGSEPESKVTGSVYRHTYAAPGAYTPVLTASNEYGSDTYEEEVEVGVPAPVAAAALSSFGLVATAAIPATRYVDTAVLTWGDGQTTPVDGALLEEGHVAEHTYASAGTYSAYLTVTNATGSDATDPKPLTVAAAEPETIAVTSTIYWPLQIDLENLLDIGADTLSVRQVVAINGVDTYHRTHVVTPDQVGFKVHTFWYFHEGDTVQLRYTPFSGVGATGTAGPTTVVDFTIPVNPATRYDDYGIVRIPYRAPSGARPDMTGATEIVLGMPGDLTADYTTTTAARDAAVAAGATNRVVLRVKNGAAMPTFVPKAGNSFPIVVEPYSKAHLPVVTAGFRLALHDPFGLATPWFEATDPAGNAQHAMAFENGAHDWYFQGIGFRPKETFRADLNSIVDMTVTGELPSDRPHRITWQHCVFRGRDLGPQKAAGLPLKHVRTGINGTGEDIAVIGSDFDEFETKATSSDGQCIFLAGSGGTEGGWLIKYNRICTGTETIMLGAGGSLHPDEVPRNITIEDNEICFPNRYFKDKPESDGVVRLHKNLWEIKNARLVLVQRNWFHTYRNQYNGSQDTVVNLKLGQGFSKEYADFCDVTFRWNVVDDIALSYSFGVRGTDNLDGTNLSAYTSRRISVYGNLFKIEPGGGREVIERAHGLLDQMGKGLPDLIFDHNTVVCTDTKLPQYTWWANANSNPTVDYWTHSLPASMANSPGRMRFTNNVLDQTADGIKTLGGTGSFSPAFKALPRFANFDPIAGNIMAGETLGVYGAKDPANPDSYNVSVANKDALPFVDRAAGNYRINPASPYAVGGALYVGTDGRNPGPDHDVLDLVRARAVAGVWTS
jgi:PKD repeat protein